MKKMVALLIALVIGCSAVAGCGKTKDADTDTKSVAETVTDEDKTEEAGNSDRYSMTCMINWRDEFTSAMDDAMRAYCEENDINYNIQDFQKDSSKLLQYIETARLAGDDAVLILEQNTEAIPQAIEAAGDMAVIVINRAPDDTSIFKGRVAYVGSQERDAGIWQGKYVAEALKEKGETVCKPIYLLGTVGAENTTSRTEGSKEAIEEAGLEVQVVAELAAEWDRANAITKIAPLLSTSDYNCIIANNDGMALGAVEAMQAAGLDPASIPIVGIDGQADGCAAVKEGTLYMTVYQSAKGQGIAAINAAINIIEGNENIAEGTDYKVDTANPNMIWVPFEPIDPENVDQYQ